MRQQWLARRIEAGTATQDDSDQALVDVRSRQRVGKHVSLLATERCLSVSNRLPFFF